MLITKTQDRELLANFFRQEPALHAYSLGDLDPTFFPDTTWWMASRGGEIQAALLLYTAFDVPILHGLTDNEAQGQLWRAVLADLPERAFVHYRRRHADILAERYHIDSHGPHWKMDWNGAAAVEAPAPRGLRRLSVHDARAIRELYARALPDAHYDLRMVAAGKSYGWFEEDTLCSIATCHVFSTAQRVATIGAVATCPRFRGQGFATAVTWALTQDVAQDVDTVALNVQAENHTAIRIYERLGFCRRHNYEEAILDSERSG